MAVRDKSQFKVTLEPEKAFIKKGEKSQLPIFVKPGDKVTVPSKITRARRAEDADHLAAALDGNPSEQAPVTVNNGQAGRNRPG